MAAEVSIQKLEDSVRDIARMLDMRLHGQHGQRIGFALFLFDFAGTATTYVSNACREDMIKFVREWLQRVESHGV